MTKLMIAALAATTALATPAMANTDTTTVWATVAPVCSIDGPADNGSIALTGTTALGPVSVTCNDPQGFTASITSANGSKLADSSNGGSPTTYDYTLSIAGVANNLSLAGSGQSFNSASYGGAAAYVADHPGLAANVSLNVGTRNGANFAGVYSDVITWTINAN
jgi:hypothetical protein